jgi:hypothetical protein
LALKSRTLRQHSSALADGSSKRKSVNMLLLSTSRVSLFKLLKAAGSICWIELFVKLSSSKPSRYWKVLGSTEVRVLKPVIVSCFKEEGRPLNDSAQSFDEAILI